MLRAAARVLGAHLLLYVERSSTTYCSGEVGSGVTPAVLYALW